MKNPGVKTLISFLDQVKRNEPVNFSTLCEGRRRGYGMVSRYLRYCLGHGLIRVVSERRARGRYPSKEYALTEKGSKLISIFEDSGPQESSRKAPQARKG